MSLDTHALVWHLEGNPALSPAVAEIFASAESQFVIPTMVLVEIWYLYQRKRIQSSISEVRAKILSAMNCSVYPLDDAVLQSLPDGLDIHDAIIVATAKVYRDFLKLPVRLITRDSEIARSLAIEVLW